jgi:transmembrane sensor
MTRPETAQEIDEAAAHWAARLDRAALSAEEERAFEAWLAGDVRRVGAFAKARAVALHTERARALGPQFDAAAFAPQMATPHARRGTAFGAIAAVLVAFVVTGVIWSQAGAQVYATRIGQVQVAPLEDGSVVTLNTASEIEVNYSKARREIELVSGEALFDVAKNAERPFIVNAGDTQVRAVGTSFSVRRLKGRPIEVLVSEGVVEVTHNGSIRRIAANVRAVAAVKSVDVVPVAPEKVDRQLAWRDGRLVFEGETLREAAREFERYSDTRIVIEDPDLANRTITGLYVPTDPVGFARAVGKAMNLKVAVAKGEVRLSR